MKQTKKSNARIRTEYQPKPSAATCHTYSEVRRFSAIGGILALLLAFGQAPSAHFHPLDPGHDHDHAAVASHRGAPAGAHLESADHDQTARYLNWVAGDGSSAPKLFALTTNAFRALPLPSARARAAKVNARNHDPPRRHRLPARAPPV
jgi:hypothetical protein